MGWMFLGGYSDETAYPSKEQAATSLVSVGEGVGSLEMYVDPPSQRLATPQEEQALPCRSQGVSPTVALVSSCCRRASSPA